MSNVSDNCEEVNGNDDVECAKVQEVANKIAKNVGIFDYKLNIVKGTTKGDNYVGSIYCVDILSPNDNLHLIVKRALKTENIRREFYVDELYSREIFAYEHLFKWYDDLRKETNDDRLYPSSYYTSDAIYEETIALENLKTIGYKLWNRKKPMNVEHARVVLTAYGKFHALSCALRRREPIKYERLYGKIKENPFYKGIDKYRESTDEAFDKLIESYDVEGADDGDRLVVDYLKKCKVGITDYFKTAIKVRENVKGTVALHGDCWINNMLFKYEDPTNAIKPISLSFIDFQVITIGKPVYDLLHFVYSCTSKEVLDDLDTCLKSYYYESFKEQLLILDCDPIVDGFTYESFMNDWRDNVRYGVLYAISFIKIMLTDTDDVPDLEKCANDGDDIFRAMQSANTDEVAYKKRMKDLILHLYERKFI